MLEELLKKESVEVKKKRLSECYGLVMNTETERRINNMCNLSEVIIEQGIQVGKQEEKENGIKIFIEDKVEDGVPEEKILSKLMKLYVLPEDAAKEYLNKYYKR